MGHCTRRVALLAVAGCVALVLPATSGATVLPPWGSSLSATPQLDTANGASFAQNDEPTSSFRNDNSDNGVSSPVSGACPPQNFGSQTLACTPWMHTGSDNTEWNAAVAGGSATAPAGGQVLSIRVKGCAQRDDSSPSQQSPSNTLGETVPVNTIEFQTLTLQSNGAFKANATAGLFQLPFCQDLPENANHVSTYTPIHMCVAPGDIVSFYDLGGTVFQNGQAWYPQGVPFKVIAQVPGSSMSSFTDADIAHGVYAPGPGPRQANAPSGLGTEQNEEVMLQVIEATGDDAYGECPGGHAVEPSGSNAVVCVTHPTSPGDPYGTCNAENRPVRPPTNTAAPTIAVSSNGGSVTGSPVPGNRMDATPGSWTQDPNQSFIRYAYQWEDCDSGGANCTPISGPVGQNPYYYATGNDVGHTIAVAVSATNNATTAGPVSSAATGVVGGPSVPAISKLKLNPSTWNEAGSSVLTYTDTQAATTTITVLHNGSVVKTINNDDRAQQYGGNGIPLKGLPAGTYQLQVTPNNRGAGGQTLTLSFTVTAATPVIAKLKVNPRAFNSARGATITYIDSQAGRATLRVLQCPKPKKPKQGRQRHSTQRAGCARPKLLKTMGHNDRAGANGVKLKGVAPGSYLLQIVSRYAGRNSAPVKTPFTARKVRAKRYAVRHGSLEPAISALVLF